MKMRFNYLLYTAVSAMLAFQSCDKGFEEMNINPDASSSPNPEFVFSKTLLDIWGNSYFSTSTLACGGSMQHFATYKEVPGLGDKYLFNQGNYPYDFFTNGYPNSVNEIATVITALDSADANNINKRSIARIMRVYIFHRITDLYGDIPYSQAGKGFTNNIFSPKYDEQSAIYADMLKELDEAAQALNPAVAATFGKGDFIYNGNVTKWKKFAYSLMLRLGMRLTKKSDQSLAQTWVTKAIAGGVIMEDADIATMKYSGAAESDRNAASVAMLGADYGVTDKGFSNIEGGKFANTFIDALKNSRDPRLNVISVVFTNGVADTSTAMQQGMPNGLRIQPANFRQLSEPNPATVLSLTAPLIVMSAAETKLLLAEAVVRGWSAGDAAILYSEAIAASMRNWALFGAAGVISSQRIAEYQAEHPLTGTNEQKFEQIATQKWVSLFLDEQEIHANWRRTGYPTLVPINVSGNATNGQIPRRLLYPPSEESQNAANLAEAIKRQGENSFVTPVWWDKP